MAWGTRVALRRPSQNRLKIGVRREGTVSNQLLETRRLTRTDGGDPASICLVARRGGYILVILSVTIQRPKKSHNHKIIPGTSTGLADVASRRPTRSRADAAGVRVSRLPYIYPATAGRGDVCLSPVPDDHAAVSTAAAARDAAGSVEPRGPARTVSAVCFRGGVASPVFR